jgi:hypothetical protein
MKTYKTSIKEVFSDDINTPFWQRIRATPEYKKFEEDLAHIAGQSLKHNGPYRQIPKDKNGVEE